MTPRNRLILTRPLHAFGVTLFGQSISLIGSGLTSFALGVEVFRTTGSTTQLSLISFFSFLPMMVLSPVAGALIDRWDRRRAMLLSDLGAGFSTICIWLLLAASHARPGWLQPWHFYLPLVLGSAFGAFRWPAFYASTTLLVPKQHLGRANGMIELIFGVSQIAAPVMAGALMARVGLQGVISIDLVSFLFAVVTLLLVRFPRPELTAAGRAARGSLWHEMAYGWTFIRARPGLVGMVVFVSTVALILSLVSLLITPLVLSFADVSTLGVILSVAGLGMMAGGLLITVWGGPRRRMKGLLAFNLLSGIALLAAGLPPSAPLVALTAALFLFTSAPISTCALAIWQVKVPPDVQGRVFAVRRVLLSAMPPVASLLAGPLADRCFEPWLAPGGALAGSAGRWIGTGPGRGIALLLVVLGVLTLASTLVAALSPRVRNVEDELPDATPDAAPAPPAGQGTEVAA